VVAEAEFIEVVERVALTPGGSLFRTLELPPEWSPSPLILGPPIVEVYGEAAIDPRISTEADETTGMTLDELIGRNEEVERQIRQIDAATIKAREDDRLMDLGEGMYFNPATLEEWLARRLLESLS
jgi:hypothetical protein